MVSSYSKELRKGPRIMLHKSMKAINGHQSAFKGNHLKRGTVEENYNHCLLPLKAAIFIALRLSIGIRITLINTKVTTVDRCVDQH